MKTFNAGTFGYRDIEEREVLLWRHLMERCVIMETSTKKFFVSDFSLNLLKKSPKISPSTNIHSFFEISHCYKFIRIFYIFGFFNSTILSFNFFPNFVLLKAWVYLNSYPLEFLRYLDRFSRYKQNSYYFFNSAFTTKIIFDLLGDNTLQKFYFWKKIQFFFVSRKDIRLSTNEFWRRLSKN